jgi:beta-galactosidase GanA
MRRKLALLASALSLAVAGLALSGIASPARSPAAPAVAAAAAPAHTIGWDKYSLTVDGQRVFVWGGEFHYYRLPSPSLWTDTLQKMKAAGFNAVSLYFDWQYHSPKQGVYDFSGVRDVDKLLTIANDLGIYVLARPGPYINAELDAGGMADWVLTDAPLRTTNPCTTNCPSYSYVTAANEWMHAIDGIIAKHQLTDGGGSVIAYQIENEISGSAENAYMASLAAQVRSDGITVPLFVNDVSPNGNWIPGSTAAPWNNLYGYDNYPMGFNCSNPNSWSNAADNEARIRNFGITNQPIFIPEFQGGSFDPWGGPGYANCQILTNGQFERVFYLTNAANDVTMESNYMTFGGTSWGWEPVPNVVYSSYDYGSAITEGRQLTGKYGSVKELGYMFASVGPLTESDPVPAAGMTDTTAGNVTPPAATTCTNGPTGATLANCGAIKVYHRANPATGTNFYFVRHNDSRGTLDSTFTVPVTTADGSYTVPQSGTLELNGRDMKVLIADWAMDSQHLVYTTSNVMTHASIAGNDVALLWAPANQSGETVLRYATQPTVDVLSGSVASTWDPATGDLRLDYLHNGLAEVRISSGGGTTRPLLLLLADDPTAQQFWTQTSGGVQLLERGPELVRGASVSGTQLNLTGDTNGATTLTAWAPAGVTSVTWNGAAVTVAANPDGSLTGTLGGPPAVSVPALTNWVYQREAPESTTNFDDSSWTHADHTITNNPTKPAAGQPVLYADDYGFHHGDNWYRGHFTPTTDLTAITLGAETGTDGVVEAWLNGTFLGSEVLGNNNTSHAFTVPAGTTVVGADNVIAVLVRDMGHPEGSGTVPRGLTSGTLTGATATIAWKLQGNQGGEDITDTVRGLENNGGLYAERAGWSLAGYPDSNWTPVSLPYSDPNPGVAWYRTTFDLNMPAGVDSSLGLTIADPATKVYRATIFLNGWNLGQYINNIGPQHTYVLPNGILRSNGHNTLAIAVITNNAGGGAAGGGLGTVSLVNLGTVASPLTVTNVDSPEYQPPVLAASVPGAAAVGETVNASATITEPPDALGTALATTIDWGDGTTTPGTLTGSNGSYTLTGSHAYAAPYAYPVKITVADRYDGAVLASYSKLVSVPATATAPVSGTVPATLALTVGPASFGAFTPGVTADYTAGAAANVISTAGDALLSVADPSSTATGHLVNGAFSLPSALQAKASSPAGVGGSYADVGGTAAPTSLLTYSGPASNDPVALLFSQHIGSTDALRTGAYSKTLTFTLSTTTP